MRAVRAGALLAAAACCLLAVSPSDAAGQAATAAAGQGLGRFLGEWLTDTHDGVIGMYACGDGLLCGRIDGMQYAGPMPTDVWKRPKCHLDLLAGLHLGDDGVARGRILDPDSGKTYAAQVRIAPDGTLKLRGYVGIVLFGRTLTWTRYHGTIGPACHLPMGTLD